MAAINPLARELVLKIVFYGPGLGGKTTTLQYIHDASSPEHRGKMVSLATAVDRTLYFDFLPLRTQQVRGMNVRLQLFTVPGQVYYNSTRRLVLTGADGIVFVVDSQAGRLDANLESLQDLRENLIELKRDLRVTSHVIQYNKRDLRTSLPVEELERVLNLYGAPCVSTIAPKGDGVAQVLELITHAVVENLDRTLPGPPSVPMAHLGWEESGLEDALRMAQAPESSSGVSLAARDMFDAAKMPSLVPPQALSLPPPGGSLLDTEHPFSQAFYLPSSTSIAAPPGLDSLHHAFAGASSARPLAGDMPVFSFAALWSEGERELVRDAENTLANKRWADALSLLNTLATRVLANAASLLGPNDAPRDTALIPVLLGIEGGRYLAFRSIVRDGRAGVEPDERTVLAAYAFVIELRLARARLGL